MQKFRLKYLYYDILYNSNGSYNKGILYIIDVSQNNIVLYKNDVLYSIVLYKHDVLYNNIV